MNEMIEYTKSTQFPLNCEPNTFHEPNLTETTLIITTSIEFMLPYQAPTAVDLLSNSHSDSTIPSESSRSIPVPPAASSVQPTNSKPVPVAPINGRTNPPVFDSTPDDSHCEFKTVELGEKYPYSLSSHVDLSVCIVLIVV